MHVLQMAEYNAAIEAEAAEQSASQTEAALVVEKEAAEQPPPGMGDAEQPPVEEEQALQPSAVQAGTGLLHDAAHLAARLQVRVWLSYTNRVLRSDSLAASMCQVGLVQCHDCVVQPLHGTAGPS